MVSLRWIGTFRGVSCGLLLALGLSATARGEEKILLRQRREAGSLLRVESQIHTQGELKLNASGKQITQLPIDVKATLAYDEKTLAANTGPRFVRHYRTAEANIRLGKNDVQSRLGDERRLVIAEPTTDDCRIYCPLTPLTRDELELLDVPGNTAILEGLLPPEAVAANQTWQPTSAALAKLLNIDVVLQNEVQGTLKTVTAGEAKCELTGQLDGSVDGIATHIQLVGKFTFDRQAGHVGWLVMKFQEKRAIGHAEPGYDVTSEVRMLAAPLSHADELSQALLADLPAAGGTTADLLTFDSPLAGLRLFHDRRWHLMVDRADLTVLRYVDGGDLLAQCNITSLPRLDKDKLLTLESFQEEVRGAVGKNFGQFVEATASNTQSGLHVLRVVAAGLVSDLPVHWIYYHVTDETGRRYSAVITLEQKLVERFGLADQNLMSTFEYRALEEAKKQK